jgi:DNA-binding SARP family transcriptional activator
LTALVAGAGYGKTATLAHFLEGADVPHLWLQLDADDNDPAVFYPYLARGIHGILGGGRRLWDALLAGGPPERPLHLVTADLQDCPGHVVIVLDDFQHLRPESRVTELVAGLLQHGGDRTHLFICSRLPLPLPTARLKVTQAAAELGENDLRFNEAEVHAYLTEAAGMDLDEVRLKQICVETEGWPAALVLLGEHLRRHDSVDEFLAGTLPPDLSAYLAEEVCQSLPENLRRFAEESAVLEVCTPAACDAAFARDDSAAAIAQLLRSNLLLTPQGSESYRYHPLLQRFLLERLKARDGGRSFRNICRQAGDWSLARSLPVDAAFYYLQGGLFAEASVLVERMASLWLYTNRLQRLHSLLAVLPAEVKADYPWISLCEAQHALNAGAAESAVGLARLAQNSFAQQNDARGGVRSALMISAIALSRRQMDDARDGLHEAEKAIRPEMRWEESVLRQTRARYTMNTKGPAAAEEDIRKALELVVELGDHPGEAAVYDLLSTQQFYAGDWASAIRLEERALEIYAGLGESPWIPTASLAAAYRRVGRFRDCERLAEPMLTSSFQKAQRVHAALNLLYSYTRRCEFTKAAEMARTAQKLIEEMGYHVVRPELTVRLAALYRLWGKPQTAVKYANESMGLVKSIPNSNTYMKAVIETVLLHLFHTGNARAAVRLTGRMLERRGSNPNFLYERVMLMLLRALAEFRQSRTESRPEGVRLLAEGLSECHQRGCEFFALHEWHLALSVAIYGLAFRVEPDFCHRLILLMDERLPEAVRSSGIELMEPEARLIPAAYRTLEDAAVREAIVRLLTPADRRRIVNLATGPAPIAIQCLGPLSITLGQEAVDVKALKRRKAGLLLVTLLSTDHPVPREQVVDRLWPNLDQAAADTSLRVALHHLRRLLEPHLGGEAKSRYIQTERGLIWFSRQPEVAVDLDQFRAALTHAEAAVSAGDRPATARSYEQACRLYRSDLAADDPYSPALQELRTTFRFRLLAALDWLGQYYWNEAKDPARAILIFQQRLVWDEAGESAHQALMRIYLENGQAAEALRQYAACREALVQLEALPSRTTESLLRQAIEADNGVADPNPKPKRPARQ